MVKVTIFKTSTYDQAPKSMKTLICLIFSASLSFSQTPGNPPPDKEALALYLPKGMDMAKKAYIAQGGPKRIGPYSVVYSNGPIKGLTEAKAIAKFNDVWAKSSAETRMMWAKRAMATGTPEIVKPDKDAERTPQDVMDEARLRDIEKKQRDMERRERDRKMGIPTE